MKPNIIFILVDDLGWRDIGSYGSQFYETPCIDALACESVRFTNAYAAAPVCSPTRASIMSGKYPARIGTTRHIGPSFPKGKLLEAPYTDHLPLEEFSMARAMKEGGYSTWHVGKWHLGGREYYPEKHGFEVNIGGCDWGLPKNGFFSPYGMENLEDGPEGEYLTDRLTDEAIHLIQTKQDKPFFLYLSHYAVHMPIQAPQELVAKYAAKAEQWGLDRMKTFEEGEKFPMDYFGDKRVIRRLQQSDPAYAAMIENLDRNIGRLLQALEETGHSENTVILFTSDNGGVSAAAKTPPTCNAPLKEGKGWMYEGGNRVPLLIKWPGTATPGRVCREPVTSPDFYPTLLNMAGLPPMPEQHVDGVSLVPLLKGEKPLEKEALYWHFPHYGNLGGTPGSSIVMGDYKLIEFFEDGRLELYHLPSDLEEQRNLADREPDIARMMQSKLSEWRNQVEAKYPTRNPDYVLD